MKRAFCVLLASAFLAACGQTELYSDLSERDVNEMLAALRGAGIEASKKPAEDSRWSLLVADDHFVPAVQTLSGQGYPRDEFADMGELFQKQGFISTPLEERARYIYGLSQELSETISAIDGVIMARVHLAMPETDPLAETLRPSSASVFIKHRPGVNLTDATTQIKGLVVNSVEGLSYDNVTVALFPTQASAGVALAAETSDLSSFGIPVSMASFALLGGLALLLSAVGGHLWNNRRKAQVADAPPQEGALLIPADKAEARHE